MMSSGPHPSVPLTQAQIAQQQQAQAHANELAKRRSRKPTDKNIPDGVEDCIIDPDSVKRYVELRDIERQIDATITRKRLDVLDDAKRSSKVALSPLSACFKLCGSIADGFFFFFLAAENASNLDQQYRRRSDLAGE